MFREVTYINDGVKGFNYGDDTVRVVSNTFADACSLASTCKDSLIVMDELLVAYDMGFVTYGEIRKLANICRANNNDLCMTGRINSKTKRMNIQLISDVVTNAFAVKHWFNSYCPKCKCEYEYHYRYCPACGTELRESKPTKRGVDF